MPSPRFKTFSIVALALTTCIAAVLAWNLYLQVIKLRAAALDDPARADLQKRLWDLEKRNKDLEAQLANRRARGGGGADEGGAADAAGNAADAGRPGGRFNRRGGFANIATLLDNPEFNKLWTQEQKSRVKLAYADLFKRLNLTPDQADKLNDLLVERQESVLDVLSAARAQGVSGRDQIGALIQQANASVDSQIQSLLGTDGYAQYNNYLQTQPQRNQVNELQTRLAAAGVPQLQDYQTQQLTQILAQNAESGSGGGGQRGGGIGGMGGVMGGIFGNNVTGPTIAPNAVTQAGTVLTAEQLQTLQQMQQEQATQQQVMSLLRQTFMNGGQGSAAGGAAAGAATGAATTATPRPRGG